MRAFYLMAVWTAVAAALTGGSAQGQDHAFEWVRKADTTSTGSGVTVDRGQHAYFTGAIDATTSVIHKLDPAGNYIWTKYFTAPVVCVFSSVQAGPGDALYVGGYFKGRTDFDPGPDSMFLTSASANNDAFVLKLDTAGNLIWVKAFGGGNNCEIYSLKTDPDGGIYTTGRFAGRADFNPGADSFHLSTTPLNQADVFIHKLDSAGNFVWVKKFDGNANGADLGRAITVNAQKQVYVGGYFRGTLDFDPGPLVYPLVSQGGVDAFLVKLSDTGAFIWARHLAGSDGQELNGLVLDDSGYIYATGTFQGNTNFDRNATNQSLVSGGGYDAFITRHDSGGVLQWVKPLGGKGRQIGYGIDLDADGNIYSTGIFADTTDFDPGPGVFHLTTPGTGTHFYISRLDRSGDFTWAKGVGSTKGEESIGLRLDASRNIYTVGTVRSDSVDFDPDPNHTFYVYVPPFPPPFGSILSNNQMFLQKLQCADTSSSVLIAESCVSYRYRDTTYTGSGVYIHRIPNSRGCDSTIFLHLTIHGLPRPVISVNGNELSTQNQYSSYQWILDGAVITGATGSTYTVMENGSYRVLVTDEYGCSDTSGAFTVTNVSVGGHQAAKAQITVAPNPVSDIVRVKAAVPVRLTLTGLDGRQVLVAGSGNTLSVAGLAEGIYLLRITDEKGILLHVEKLVRQK